MSKFVKLRREDILRFFVSVGASKPCQLCGSTEFDLFDEAVNDRVACFTALKPPENDIGLGKTLDLILMSCGRCHYIRPHARKPIAEWIEGHPA